MFELCEQELEQVAGGQSVASSQAWAKGSASAKKGVISSTTQTSQHSGYNYASSSASNATSVSGTDGSAGSTIGTSSSIQK
ncbi:hypothetical protein EPA93_04860 [Ktedonosporobacter rubrisoli]|uniref:Bacteriocin n=1 Tax=Ktedonosporobacter rubrisoli TaxID=2509675 RepID=A0A4P6JL29_KTERU|nr:hypothetical protein [Ktedonosporobacter rubrisoli]QBD75366.1 hypothetical protein EPA93_04860 [Ktedonosporobacter rubrisoli]